MTYDPETLERPQVRRRDAEATRAAILAAGKTHFARSGYEGAYLRDIAADAGADAALINRYFGGKEGLFNACLREAVRSEKLFEIDRDRFGERLAKTFAAKSAPGSDDTLQGFRLILRAATSTATAHMLNEAVQERFMGPIREWLGGPEAAARARLITALFVGLLVEGLIRDEPLSEPERSAFAERLSAILQTLVDR
ncbi:MAG TPA: TetR family transcriptional regulator [Caulobacteraceae bacterium]|nr:TetR family transcriptional regulator [Caulobacteraceae bacterium]